MRERALKWVLRQLGIDLDGGVLPADFDEACTSLVEQIAGDLLDRPDEGV